MSTAASWILGIGLSVAFTLAGYAKVSDQGVMVKARNHLGLPADVYRTIGAAELVGAIGLLSGLVSGLEVVGVSAALGLVVLMVAAVGYHMRAGDALTEAIPAVALLLLCLIYIAVKTLG
ncbi:MAG: DoxX family protein [Acidimicrobiales bacterium]